jgi:hypothetical protein
MKPYPYQQKLIDSNPKKEILAWEMRVGKSLPAAIWIDNPCRAGNTFIVTPKQNKQDWLAFNTKATVLTKEEFKKIKIIKPTAIVVDELHYFASPLFIKGRSQLAGALYTLIKENPTMDFLGLTGTPIRQDAWSLHTLLCYKGVYYDWKAWRNMFFELKRMPFLRFPAYFPKKDWRIKIRPILEKHCNIISLRDVIDYLPPITPVIIKIKQPKYEKPKDEIVTWTHEHLHEQENKYKEISKLDYRKVLVVAFYTDQIDDLERELSKYKPVYILDGRTKDASQVKKEAQESDDCYFIVQSSMGFAFDAWMFGAMVFASMAHSCFAHTQMSGRLRNLEHLKPYNIYYLIGGRWDQRIYNCIEAGKDFNPSYYQHVT